MRRKRKEFLAQNEAPGGAGCARGCGLYFGFNMAIWIAILSLGQAGHYAALAAMLILLSFFGMLLSLPSVFRGAVRSGITVDADGLTEWYDFGIRRRTNWIDVTRVQVEEDAAYITTPRRVVRLAPPLTDWLQIAHRAQAGSGLAPAVDREREQLLRLPPQVVAGWLGVPVDGEMRGESQFFRRQRLALGLGILLVLTIGWLGLPFLAFGLGLPRKQRRVDAVRATPESIEVHSPTGWRTYSWGGLTSLARRGRIWHVTTTEGDLWLPPMGPMGEQLIHAIRQAIDARQAGWTLPERPVDVPETALSRMTGESQPEAERGLSQVVEPEE